MTTDLVEAIASELGISREDAGSLHVLARPLWKRMAALGIVDSYGGAECVRLLPAMLRYVQHEANKPAPKPRRPRTKKAS